MDGMKRKKLLNKTLSYYLAFGGLTVLTIVPAYYFLYNKYYLHETDEFLLRQKEKTYAESLRTLKISEIPVWNQYNDDKAIIPPNGQKVDNVYATAKFPDEKEVAHEDFRILYSGIKIEDRDYILMIRLSTFEAKKIILSGTIVQLAFFFFLLLGFVFVTHRVYGKLWKPFYRTLSDIERFNIRGGEIPAFTPTDVLEFEQLNRSVGNLMADNLQAYKIQKEFTENASHEMQTPLAVLLSRLDLLLQRDLTEEQLRIVQSLYESVSRMTRMNKNLLLSAKIDNLQFEDAQSSDVAEILRESLPFLREQADVNHIDIKADINENNIVGANKTLLESLVNNLLANAVKHNVPYGEIHISLNGNLLSVTNTGDAAIPDENMLFRRFGRMNEKVKGSGLGLAIAKQICSLYGWEIRYEYENGRHRFEVNF